MADLIYCGTEPVGSAETQALLAGPFAAIWSPPMHRRASPQLGARLWLLWRSEGQAPVILGVGNVLLTPDGRADWTNRTAPGVVEAARALGYGGPTNMAFLRLSDVHIWGNTPAVIGLADVAVGLTAATQSQSAMLPLIERMFTSGLGLAT